MKSEPAQRSKTAGARPGTARAADGARESQPVQEQTGAARRALVVVGMHRSGTSAFARLLSLCGARLPEHLMPAGERNPRGYYESQAIYELHQQLLAEAGSSWDDASPFPPEWFHSPMAPGWVRRMAQTVRDEFGDHPLIILKDPRICRLVRFWLAVLERLRIEPAFVLPVRNPADVAASLRRAEGTDEPKALLLWLQHFLAAERDTRGFTRSFVSYEAVLNDWRSVLAKLSGDLGLVFPRIARRAAAEVDDFLERELQHHATSSQQFLDRHDVSQWVKTAYDWATRAAAGEDVDPGILDQVDAQLGPAESVFGPLLASVEVSRASARDQVQRLEARIEGLQQETARLREELGSARRQVSLGTEDLARMRDQLSLQEQQTAQLIEWIKVLLQWSSHVIHGGEATTHHLEAVLEALDAADPGAVPQIATTGIRLAQQSAEVARLSEEVDVRTAELEGARHEMAGLREQLASKELEISRIGQERQSDVDRLEQQIRGLWQQLSARDTEFARLKDASAAGRDEAARLSVEVQTLLEKISAREARAVELERQLKQEVGAVVERDLFIRQLRARLGGIEGSRTWRASRPVRLLAEGAAAIFKK